MNKNKFEKGNLIMAKSDSTYYGFILFVSDNYLVHWTRSNFELNNSFDYVNNSFKLLTDIFEEN